LHRNPDVSFVNNYIVSMSAAVVVGVGLIYMVIAKPYDRGDVPVGDATPEINLRITSAASTQSETSESTMGIPARRP
jgi:hypothetical protein